MATLDDLKTWIDRDIRPRWRVETTEDTATSLTCKITTNKYVFTITADSTSDYLGCTCRTRYIAPGKRHPQFADLPDGSLADEMWQTILQEIKRFHVGPYRGPSL